MALLREVLLLSAHTPHKLHQLWTLSESEEKQDFRWANRGKFLRYELNLYFLHAVNGKNWKILCWTFQGCETKQLKVGVRKTELSLPVKAYPKKKLPLSVGFIICRGCNRHQKEINPVWYAEGFSLFLPTICAPNQNQMGTYEIFVGIQSAQVSWSSKIHVLASQIHTSCSDWWTVDQFQEVCDTEEPTFSSWLQSYFTSEPENLHWFSRSVAQLQKAGQTGSC